MNKKFIFSSILSIMACLTSVLFMTFGIIILFSAEFWTQVTMGCIFFFNSLAFFIIVIANLIFKYKRQLLLANLMDRWLSTITGEFLLILVINNCWHLYVTANNLIISEFVIIGFLSILTSLYLKLLFKTIKLEAKYFKMMRCELSAELENS